MCLYILLDRISMLVLCMIFLSLCMLVLCYMVFVGLCGVLIRIICVFGVIVVVRWLNGIV